MNFFKKSFILIIFYGNNVQTNQVKPINFDSLFPNSINKEIQKNYVKMAILIKESNNLDVKIFLDNFFDLVIELNYLIILLAKDTVYKEDLYYYQKILLNLKNLFEQNIIDKQNINYLLIINLLNKAYDKLPNIINT